MSIELENKQSLSGKNWKLGEVDEAKAQRIAARFGFSKTLSRLIALRDIEEESIDSFLNPKLRDLLPDPSIMADMDKAVTTVMEAIEAKENIAIYGDYDVDGISTVALLKNYFSMINVECETHLPDRMLDGYGLNIAALKKAKANNCDLVITVDCGAKDFKALSYAKQQNMKVIVLDHHPTDVSPPACAFVNPNGPEDKSGLGNLTAGGVAFMFLVSFNRSLRKASKQAPDLMQFLDFVALSTVCDVAPLVGLNRAFVMRGIELLAKRNNLGLTYLADSAGMRGKPNVESFSFSLGPRINAAGRIGKADLALLLLTSQDETQAEHLTKQLNTLNRQRQGIEKNMLSEAMARLKALPPHAEAVIVSSDGWHKGVIGIIAARLRDYYNRTAAVVAFDGAVGTGSIRGDGNVDLGEIMAEAMGKELLLRGGGHKQAAGFTIASEKLEDFQDFFVKSCASRKANMEKSNEIDAVLDFSAATRSLYEELQKAAPYGKGNKLPSLLFTDGRLMHARISGNGHLRCRFQPAKGGRAIEVVGFNQANTKLGQGLQQGVGELFHIAGNLRPAWQNMVSGVEIALSDALAA